ncbi:MAG: 2-hydroxychromene-2-carboxylate isomerase [Gammaproteobacteria bacterium]
MPITLDYYLTLNSPWAYLGSARFLAMTRKAGATVRVKPAKFGDIFAATGGLPLPKRAPERRAYRMMELKRWRDHLAIPINLEPKGFPSDEGAAARLVIATADAGLDALAFSAECGRAIWERQESLGDPAVIEAAAGRAGIDLAAVRAGAAPDADLDAKWERNTGEAIGRGVFGAPAYVFEDGEIMWGQDRLMFVEKRLTGAGNAG